MELLAAAITLGILGSFHCVGMCGPIALALPVHQKPPMQKNLLVALYNLGRIGTYTLFGLLAGILGKSFAMAGSQQILSVTVGIILLLSVFIPAKKTIPAYGFFLWIKTSLSRMFPKSSRSSLFTIGLLNGFLPCGMVYAAMAGATASGDVLKGALFMLAFGLGTAPMMYALPFIGGDLSLRARKRIGKARPLIVAIMALLLVLRGLDLGIPYLSPSVNNGQPSACHPLSTHHNTLIHCQAPEKP